MSQTLKRLPVLTLPLQCILNQSLKLVGVVWDHLPPYVSVPPAPIHVAQSVILNFAGLEVLTAGGVGTREVLTKYDAIWV